MKFVEKDYNFLNAEHESVICVKISLLSDNPESARFFFSLFRIHVCSMKKTLLLFIAALPVLLFAQGIGHTTVTYTDPARSNRQIATEIYYPAATTANNVPISPGTYPVIVFGHGFVMVYSAYQNIWNALVPQGYIVAFPTTEGSLSPVHADFGADLAFLVGAIQADGNNASSLFYQHVATRSAIMGHSMGGGCSFLAAENNVNITSDGHAGCGEYQSIFDLGCCRCQHSIAGDCR
jgi:hypothetical protein